MFSQEKPIKPSLMPEELTMKFFAHACMEFKFGDHRIFTDPWLEGPAFMGGWWLSQLPPKNWLECLGNADHVYISHNHSDHLHLQTLEKVYAHYPDLCFLVPNFETKSVEIPLRQIGFKNLKVLDFGKEYKINDDTSVMMLIDGAGRDDSGIIFKYKGYSILNAVDCANPNNLDFPPHLDCYLSSFAGGASGYPVCWQDLYSDTEIESLVERNLAEDVNSKRRNLQKAQPKMYVPFAGYFSEEAPIDARIKRINKKNSPQAFTTALAKTLPDLKFWLPKSGYIYDLGQGREIIPKKIERTKNNIAEYFAKLEATPILSDAEIESYLQNLDYHGDLILEIVETNIDFSQTYRRTLFDFSKGMAIETRPERKHQYSRIKVRQKVFNHVVAHNLPWEDFSIGFQASFYREPDVYEFDFWSHVQNMLPGPKHPSP